MMEHELSAYPDVMAKALVDRWQEAMYPHEDLPSQKNIAALLDTMYQASLLREEGNAVRCRIMIAPASDFTNELAAGDSQLHVLRFTEPCDFTPHELRKLAAAAGYYRALLAIDVSDEGLISIWGMIVTGTTWINQVEDDRIRNSLLPERLVIQCLGPGHLIVAAGNARILESLSGKLLTNGFDPFRSNWLPQKFGTVRTSLLAELDELIPESDKNNTRMCESFVKDIAQSVVRRVLRLVRSRGHGGMLVYLPEEKNNSPLLDQWFRFRVRFEQDDSINRFRRLMLSLIKRGREIGQARGLEVVTWYDYLQMQDAELAELDKALIELGHFFTDLMNVDGSLVLDRSFRLIGFGGEILGDSHAATIHRALDLEAERSVVERADSSGTRHRSAYRLVCGLQDAIAVVVSQDGDVRFVAHHNDKLTYWPYLP